MSRSICALVEQSHMINLSSSGCANDGPTPNEDHQRGHLLRTNSALKKAKWLSVKN